MILNPWTTYTITCGDARCRSRRFVSLDRHKSKGLLGVNRKAPDISTRSKVNSDGISFTLLNLLTNAGPKRIRANICERSRKGCNLSVDDSCEKKLVFMKLGGTFTEDSRLPRMIRDHVPSRSHMLWSPGTGTIPEHGGRLGLVGLEWRSNH